VPSFHKGNTHGTSLVVSMGTLFLKTFVLGKAENERAGLVYALRIYSTRKTAGKNFQRASYRRSIENTIYHFSMELPKKIMTPCYLRRTLGVQTCGVTWPIVMQESIMWTMTMRVARITWVARENHVVNVCAVFYVVDAIFCLVWQKITRNI